jgi:hypothetical protein
MRRHILVTAAAVAAITATAPTATAAPQTIPNGPWVQERQHVSLERLHSYDEMVTALRRIERSSHGRVSLEVIGQSNEGRDLYLARVGTGPTKVLYITQQHGNEPLGTEAALQLLGRLGNGGGAGWNAILSRITLLVVPKVNPDGSERFQRQNHDPDCAGAFCTPGVGFDVNRWHDPAVAPEVNPVPEAAAVQRAFARYQPSFVVDFHHQGSYVSDDGDLITTSIFWPSAAGVPADALALSRQTCVVINDTLSHYGFAEVSQYPGTLPRGIARNAYGLLGASSVLVEFRGGIGQKSAGMLVRTAYTIMGALAESIAEGTVYAQDPARADDIPLRGDFVDNPHE